MKQSHAHREPFAEPYDTEPHDTGPHETGPHASADGRGPYVRQLHDRRKPDAVITAAEPSQRDQLRSRERRYATMMGIRVVCLIAAVLTFHVFWPVAVVFIVGMIVLPWCAVLIANDRPPLKPSLFQRYRGHPNPGRAIEAQQHQVIDEDK